MAPLLTVLIAPMEPVPVPAPPPGEAPGFPFTDPAYAFQLKWDGVRMLAFLEDGRVRLQNRRLRDRTAIYPEFTALAAQVQARQAILDGEVVVLREGRPSFPLVLQRELVTAAGAPARLARTLPAAFATFDLLSLDGADLTGRPWWSRQEVLGRRLIPGGVLHRVGNSDDGPALWSAVTAQGLEGVVAKVRISPYVPGHKSRHWLKIKVRRRLDAVIGGYTRSGGALGALLVGLYRLPEIGTADATAPSLVYIGRVGTGLTEAERLALAQHLRSLETARPPFAHPPRLSGLDVRWVEPVLMVTVAFSEWTEDLRLRAPSVLGFGHADPWECRL